MAEVKRNLIPPSEEELESLDEVKEESKKVDLKLNIQKTKIMAFWSHHFMANRRGKKWKQWQILGSCTPKSLQMVIAAMKLSYDWSLEEKLWPN